MKKTLITLLTAMMCCTALFTTFFSVADEYDDGVYELNRGQFQKAKTIFEPLAEANYAPAQYQMAIIYLDNYGPLKDIDKGLVFMHKAAKQNYTDALFSLAVIYTEGEIVKQDLKKAYDLTRKAALNKLVSAQFNLAVMYAQGQGTDVNNTQAVRWYKEAADKGYVLAQFNLALMYYDGKGVEQSYYWSYVWNTIAARSGYKNAETSRILDERILSPDEIKAGRREASALYNRLKQKNNRRNKQAVNAL